MARWAPEDRRRVGDFGAGCALNDRQHARLEPHIPGARPGGRPRTTDMRSVLDALFYIARTGCQWRHLPPPPCSPPWQTVYGYFRAFIDAGVWDAIQHALVLAVREHEGRAARPSAAIIDSQSVRTTERGDPGAGTVPSGSSAASAMSWSPRSDCRWQSSSIGATCRTATARPSSWRG